MRSTPSSARQEDKYPAGVLVHERAICESVDVGQGTRLWAFSHVMAGARVGSDCNIGEHVFIENGATIGDRCTIKNGVAVWTAVSLENDVFVGPYAVFTNDLRPRAFLKRPLSDFLPTRVGEGASIGANSTIVCGVTIGRFSLVAAGAIVTRDVPSHSLVAGNPARVMGRVCYCGSRLLAKDTCPECHLSLSVNSLEQVRKFLKKSKHG